MEQQVDDSTDTHLGYGGLPLPEIPPISRWSDTEKQPIDLEKSRLLAKKRRLHMTLWIIFDFAMGFLVPIVFEECVSLYFTFAISKYHLIRFTKPALTCTALALLALNVYAAIYFAKKDRPYITAGIMLQLFPFFYALGGMLGY